MRLAKLALGPGAVAVTAPLEFHRPEAHWETCLSDGTIPRALFDFYTKATYFNPSSAPRFLGGPDPHLYAFLRGVAEGLLESLRDARSSAESLKELRAKEWAARPTPLYAPDRTLIAEENRALRDLVLALSGSLDQLAEIIALVYFRDVPGLAPGRAQFQTILRTLKKSVPSSTIVIRPIDPLLDELRRHILVKTEESGWLDLLLLYRNKLAHLGNRMFVQTGLADGDGKMYYFLPSEWPWFLESQMGTSAGHRAGGPTGSLVGQDVVQFSFGAVRKVRTLLDGGLKVIHEHFSIVKDAAPKPGLLEAYRANAEAHPFKAFADDREEFP